MKHVLLQPAYVLHRRSYRETSVLVELFAEEHGRFTAIAKGVRQSRSSLSGLLQPFVPLLISWTGKSDLMILSHAELRGEARLFSGECLFAGFYLNELLMNLLEKWDAHPILYSAYEQTINILQSGKLEQKTLRAFEKCLLEELGYGLLPTSDFVLEKTFLSDQYYQFTVEQGFVLAKKNANQEQLFSGKSLLAIAKEEWCDEEILRDAKRLMRFALTLLLGERPIHSRRLFLQQNESDASEVAVIQ